MRGAGRGASAASIGIVDVGCRGNGFGRAGGAGTPLGFGRGGSMRATLPAGGGFFATRFGVGIEPAADSCAAIAAVDDADSAATATASRARLNLLRFGGRRDCFIFGRKLVKCFNGQDVVCTASNSTTFAGTAEIRVAEFAGVTNAGFVGASAGAGVGSVGNGLCGGGCILTGI